VGYKFTLVLSREITDEESEILRKVGGGCADAVFGPDTLPTNAEVPVTKMDFDDTVSATLAEAIQAGLDAVKEVPDLSVPGLTVPAQPAGPVTEEEQPEGTATETATHDGVIEGVVVETVHPETKPGAKKQGAKKASAGKASAGKASAGKASAGKAGAGKPRAKKASAATEPAEAPVEAATGSA
jgi:hypothetical protein